MVIRRCPKTLLYTTCALALFGVEACAAAVEESPPSWVLTNGGTVETIGKTEHFHLHDLLQDDEALYWSLSEAETMAEGVSAADGIYRVPKSGGTPRLLHATASVVGLAVDSGYVYWTEGAGDGSVIRRVPKKGGNAETFFASPLAPGGGSIVTDADYVYWASGRPTVGSGLAQAIHTISKTSREAALTTLPGSDYVDGLQLKEGLLYFWHYDPVAASRRIESMPVSGGPFTTVGAPMDARSSVSGKFAVQGDFLFFCETKPLSTTTTVMRASISTGQRVMLSPSLEGSPDCDFAEATGEGVWMSSYSRSTAQGRGNTESTMTIYRWQAGRTELSIHAQRKYPTDMQDDPPHGVVVDKSRLYWFEVGPNAAYTSILSAPTAASASATGPARSD